MRLASALLSIGLVMISCASAQSSVPLGVPLRGRVMYPDGAPAAHAKVVATTACEGAAVNFVQDTLTTNDGSFVIPSFDDSCGKVRFTAEMRTAFWLRTGTEVFYPRPNGTAPELVVSGPVPPEPVTIQLDLRGGELELHVWDASSGRYVRAGISIDCPGPWCGAMSTATAEGGSAHTVFLPPRRYRISLNWFPCGGKTYFPEKPPSLIVDVVEGESRTAELRVDLATLEAKSSYDNPEGVACRP